MMITMSSAKRLILLPSSGNAVNDIIKVDNAQQGAKSRALGTPDPGIPSKQYYS